METRIEANASMAPAPGKRTYRAGDLPRQLWGVLRSTPRLIVIYRRGGFDPTLRERIMAAVSRANACRYCTMAHETLEARRLSEAEASDPSPAGFKRSGQSDRMAVAYAIARAEARPLLVAPELKSALRHHFDEREQGDIDAIVDLAMFTSLSMNSAEALLNRMRRLKPQLASRNKETAPGP